SPRSASGCSTCWKMTSCGGWRCGRWKGTATTRSRANWAGRGPRRNANSIGYAVPGNRSWAMNDASPPDSESLSLEIVEQVDENCDRYEDVWQQGQRPQVEDYLGPLAGPGRSALLRELIKLDIEYRRRAGEHATPEDYRRLFPMSDFLASVETVLDPTRPEVD